MTAAVEHVGIAWAGRTVRIEYQWLARERLNTPLIVFLHEGLGSVSMWKDFPQQLCDATGCRGLVYSRPGYGGSTPREAHEHWGPDFMHRQADEVLPAWLAALGVDPLQQATWLLGHSDGGTIALLHAARHPDLIAGAIVLAPHIMVEDVSIRSIEQAREAYLNTDLRTRLAKHHADPDSAFWGWNNAWLSPGFRSWSIEEDLANIRCPLLAVQGLDDPYGTLAQIRGIARLAPQTELQEWPDCGHSPHRDQTERLLSHASAFIRSHTAPAAGPS